MHVGGASLSSGPLGRKHLARWHRYADRWADAQPRDEAWQSRHQLWGTVNSESSGDGADGHSTSARRGREEYTRRSDGD